MSMLALLRSPWQERSTAERFGQTGWNPSPVAFDYRACRTSPPILLRVWWIDSIASLAIVYFLVTEGRKAWLGEEPGCHDH
jgi:hypothetical protein